MGAPGLEPQACHTAHLTALPASPPVWIIPKLGAQTCVAQGCGRPSVTDVARQPAWHKQHTQSHDNTWCKSLTGLSRRLPWARQPVFLSNPLPTPHPPQTTSPTMAPGPIHKWHPPPPRPLQRGHPAGSMALSAWSARPRPVLPPLPPPHQDHGSRARRSPART